MAHKHITSYFPNFENLENRELMASGLSASLSGGILYLRGTSGNDTIRVRESGGKLTVDGVRDSFSVSRVKEIKVYGYNGNDVIDLSRVRSVGSMVDGGSGRDKMYGGSGNDTMYGGKGKDTMYGGSGRDYMDGQTNKDYMDGEGGSDTMFGGTNNDTMYGGNGKDYMDGESGKDYLDGEGNKDTLYGGSNDDTLYGGSNQDYMDGESGNDYMDGENDKDTMYGGSGNDTMYGGSHADDMDGEGDNDKLYGENGNDTLDGGAGNDKLVGDTGSDYMDGASGKDTMYGGTGKDTMYGGSGRDYMKGGSGKDRMDGESGTDTLYGETGDDTLYGIASNDKLKGGSGNNAFRLSAGDADTGKNGNSKTNRIVKAIDDAIRTNQEFIERYRAVLEAGGTLELKDTKLGRFLAGILRETRVGNQGEVTLDSMSVRVANGAGPFGMDDLEINLVLTRRIRHSWGNGVSIDITNRLDVKALYLQTMKVIAIAVITENPFKFINLLETTQVKHYVRLGNGKFIKVHDSARWRWLSQVYTLLDTIETASDVYNNWDQYVEKAGEIWDNASGWL